VYASRRTQKLTTEQAVFLRDAAAQQFANEQTITKRMIAAVPDENHDYRPDPKAKTALELAWHIASAEVFFLNSIASGVFAPGGKMPEELKTGADIAKWYEEHSAAALGRFKDASGEDLAKVIDFRGVYQLPAISFANLALNHAIHHRGELTTYIRPMGGKCPRVYGGSADDPMVLPAAAKA
jgi:uncharacterized damage-inducible protein DinB